MVRGTDIGANGTRHLLGEGGRIGAILAVWGSLALAGYYGVGSVGLASPGRSSLGFGESLALLFALTGIINVLVYVGARGIQRADR